MSFKHTAAVAGLAGALGATLALGGAWHLGAFAAKPMPVAVVNFGGLIRTGAGGEAVEQADIDKGFEQMRRIGETLAAKGYLVLDARSVVDAPEGFYVPRREPAAGKGAGGE